MLKINENKFYSATDLKNNTKKVLDKSSELWEVIIMNNNKPKAVLMSIEKYNELNNRSIILEWDLNEDISEYWDDVSSFLNNLK